MKFLLIEDEVDFIGRMKELVKEYGDDIQMVSIQDTELTKKFDENIEQAIEDQLVSRIKNIQEKQAFDLVLLDTDLSKITNGAGQIAYRQAFQELGIPVCRYTKRQSDTEISIGKRLKRIAYEGASAVWVPGDKVKGDLKAANTLGWLLGIHHGFSQLFEKLSQGTKPLKASSGPAGILANALDRSTAKSDFLGYTAQNFFYFASDSPSPNEGEQFTKSQATRLGYWLLNYILTFPGPILNFKAAAAFLNLTESAFATKEVQDLVSVAAYSGPFSRLDSFFWKEDLIDIIDKHAGDIATAESLQKFELQRIDAQNPGASAYFCVVSQSPIAESEAAPRLDWMPSGAQLARIRQDLYDELGPLLSI